MNLPDFGPTYLELADILRKGSLVKGNRHRSFSWKGYYDILTSSMRYQVFLYDAHRIRDIRRSWHNTMLEVLIGRMPLLHAVLPACPQLTRNKLKMVVSLRKV